MVFSGASGCPKTERIKRQGIQPPVRRVGLLSYREAAGIIPHRPTPSPRLEGLANLAEGGFGLAGLLGNVGAILRRLVGLVGAIERAFCASSLARFRSVNFSA